VSSAFAIDVPADLLAAARRGEARAQERLYRLFERPAYTLALRLLADPEDARDVLHDALLAVFGRLHQFRGECPFWAWLRQVVVNTALMRLRRRRQLDAREARGGGGGEPLDERAPPPSLAAEAAVLERALARLPATTRSVVWLACVEGYSHPEIAASMQQSVSFSKSQLARGLARLRRMLATDTEACHA